MVISQKDKSPLWQIKKTSLQEVFFIWGQIDKVRTFLLESVKDEDSFLRILKIV